MTLLAAALLASTPAHALSCAWMDLRDALPQDGAVDVPTNAQPVLRLMGVSPPGSGEAGEATVTLTVVETGEELPVQVQVLEADDPTTTTWVVQPDTPLPADTTLALDVVSAEDWELDRTISFTTEAGEDDEAPAQATADALLYSRDKDEWGTWRALTVGLAGGEDEPGSWWRIELADNPDFTGARVRASLQQPARFHDDPCAEDALAASKPGETWVRVTTIDAAGNEATPAIERFDGPTNPFGCSSTGAAPGLLGALVGLLGVVGVRRRR